MIKGFYFSSKIENNKGDRDFKYHYVLHFAPVMYKKGITYSPVLVFTEMTCSSLNHFLNDTLRDALR